MEYCKERKQYGMNQGNLDDLIENDQAFMVYIPNNLHGEVGRHRLVSFDQNIEFFKINN